jgi:hypothetical protein
LSHARFVPHCRFSSIVDTTYGVQSLNSVEPTTQRSKFFYGWMIVAVGFLAHIASAFSISSTLSVFLKPLPSDLGVSRGVFSLIRTGEVLIGSVAAPLRPVVTLYAPASGRHGTVAGWEIEH